MEYTSVFDIIGPIMVGPSSSHTAGALGIAKFARKQFGKKPKHIKITLYNSFAKTYKGHGTDVALVGGILDYDTDDVRIPLALEAIKKANIEIEFVLSNTKVSHPNTVKLVLDADGKTLTVIGISLGGGSFQILLEKWNDNDDDI